MDEENVLGQSAIFSACSGLREEGGEGDIEQNRRWERLLLCFTLFARW